jgi:hypothetical protein
MIERWIITEVMNELAAPRPSTTAQPTAGGINAIYLYKDDNRNYLELRADGSFTLVQLGKQFQGRYGSSGDEIVLPLGGIPTKAQLRGDSLFDSQGKEWVKKAEASSSQEGNGAFTDADVIKLIENKLPDSVIIAKIASSSCTFDTGTDALISLKRANASDAVVQALVSCKR